MLMMRVREGQVEARVSVRRAAWVGSGLYALVKLLKLACSSLDGEIAESWGVGSDSGIGGGRHGGSFGGSVGDVSDLESTEL